MRIIKGSPYGGRRSIIEAYAAAVKRPARPLVRLEHHWRQRGRNSPSGAAAPKKAVAAGINPGPPSNIGRGENGLLTRP